MATGRPRLISSVRCRPASASPRGSPSAPTYPMSSVQYPTRRSGSPTARLRIASTVERIVLGAEQAGHLGQVASNRQAVQGDEEGGDGQGHTGSRLEREEHGRCRTSSGRRRDSRPMTAAPDQGDHGADDQHGRSACARSPRGSSRRSRTRIARPTDPHTRMVVHVDDGSEEAASPMFEVNEHGTVSAERAAIQVEQRLVDEGANHARQADANETQRPRTTSHGRDANVSAGRRSAARATERAAERPAARAPTSGSDLLTLPTPQVTPAHERPARVAATLPTVRPRTTARCRRPASVNGTTRPRRPARRAPSPLAGDSRPRLQRRRR